MFAYGGDGVAADPSRSPSGAPAAAPRLRNCVPGWPAACREMNPDAPLQSLAVAVTPSAASNAIARRPFVFWTVTGLIAVDTILFTLVIPALPVFADRYDLSNSEAALIFAAFPVLQLPVAFGAGGLVDRYGRRPGIIGAGALLLAATAAFALVTDPILLVVARGAQGAAAGLAWTAGIAAISDVYPNDQLGFRIGLAETAGGGAGLIGPVVGGVLIGAVGTTATFALACALPAVFLLIAFFIPETRRGSPARQPLTVAFRRVLNQPTARAGAAALIGTAAILALLEPLLPLNLVERHDSSPAVVGLVFSAGLLGYFIGAPLAGRWSDRHGRRQPIIVGGLGLALTLPLITIGPPAWVAVWFVPVGGFMAVLAAPSGPLLTKAADDAGMAGMYGVSAAVLVVIFAAGYALGPLTGAAASVVAPFWLIVVVASVAVAALATFAYRVLDPDRDVR